jgi:hypothetical protein
MLTFQNFIQHSGYVTNPPTTESQIQNAADDNQLAIKMQGTNRVKLVCVRSPLLHLNSKDLLSQNEQATYNSTHPTFYQKCGGGKRYW